MQVGYKHELGCWLLSQTPEERYGSASKWPRTAMSEGVQGKVYKHMAIPNYSIVRG